MDFGFHLLHLLIQEIDMLMMPLEMQEVKHQGKLVQCYFLCSYALID